MLKPPCLSCSDRAEGCHAICERYKAFRAEWDSRRDRRKKNERGAYEAETFLIAQKMKRKRVKNR